MAISLDALMQKVSGSITPPDNAFRIRELLDDENASLADIALSVEQDPPLATAVIRMANSSLFSGHLRVGSVTRAVTRLGTLQTVELVTAIGVVRAFNGLKPDRHWAREFWKRASYAAGSARLLAYLARLPERDSAFTAGLLHNIGSLVIATQLPEEAEKIRELCHFGANDLAAEREILGYDHTDIGELLAERWALPEELSQCIGHHREPMLLSPCPPMVWVTHISASWAQLMLINSDDAEQSFAIDKAAWPALGLDANDMPEILRALNAVTVDLDQIISH